MPRYIKIKNCLDCPDRSHSGSFTKGGAWPVCDNNDVCYKRPGIKPEDWYKRRLPCKSGTREYNGKIPAFCPLKKGN